MGVLRIDKTVSDIGEYEIINRIDRLIDKDPDMLLQFGDDAVGIPFPKKALIINTDMFVGSTDIPPGMTYYQIGGKVVTMTVSDIVAKGGTPRGVLLSLGLPQTFLVCDLDQIIRGVNDKIRQYGGWFWGGDLNQANDLVLDGIAVGESSNVLPRIGSQPGNLVVVSGEFGLTAAGLDLLLNHRIVPELLRTLLSQSVFEPSTPVELGALLGKTEGITGILDSSDGLARSLHLLSMQNQVGITITELPIASEALEYAALFNIDPVDLVFYGGEEFHLVFTCTETTFEILNSSYPSLRSIGVVTDTRDVTLDLGSTNRKSIKNQGWQHFSP